MMNMPVRQQQQQQRPTATRWDPFSELQRIYSELRAPEGSREVPGATEGFVPIADLEETEDGYVIEVELPGVKRDDIDIAVAGRRVTVSGERKEKERTGILRRRERVVGRFRFEVELPNEIDEGGVNASLDNGVLTLKVPKRRDSQVRRIAVS
jgi:HSP20 family protein